MWHKFLPIIFTTLINIELVLANQKDGCSHWKEETFNEFWPHVVQRKQYIYQESKKGSAAYKV
jgi:hypothetical protein